MYAQNKNKTIITIKLDILKFLSKKINIFVVKPISKYSSCLIKCEKYHHNQKKYIYKISLITELLVGNEKREIKTNLTYNGVFGKFGLKA